MTVSHRKKITLQTLARKIDGGKKIIGMECHDTTSAMIAEELGMDILCCSSPGPVCMMGHASADTVEFDELLFMFKGVLRGAVTPFMVCNLPNTTVCVSTEEAVRNADRVMKLGGDGVHIEPTLGMMPMVKAIADAGIVAVLIEHATSEVTRWCSDNLKVPVISLGAGADADGIFHVSSDVIGCSVHPIPPKREVFGDIRQNMHDAYSAYINAARSGAFPKPKHCHYMPDEEKRRFLDLMDNRRIE